MSIRLSDSIRNKLLDGGSGGGIKGGLNNCLCAIFSGAQPASANDGMTGTLLGVLSVDGDGSTGMTWDAAVSGALSKAAAETWRVTWAQAGVAGCFRFYLSGDVLTNADATAPRIDGSCGTSGADLNLTNLSTVIGRIDTCDGFVLTMPPGLGV